WALAEEGDAVVLVTHRLAATANADRIYVLDQGRVAEEGTHDELMAHQDGLYHGMFTAQAAQFGLTASPETPVPAARHASPPVQEDAS
ncbi:ABC transporter ATP-binding protein, partial [Streptomyces mirabilis]